MDSIYIYDGQFVTGDAGFDMIRGAAARHCAENGIDFDYDKSVVKPMYFEDLDKIVKILRRHPEASALIEGHADQLRTSKAAYNRRLSERRAEAVRQYIAGKGVEAGRMRAVGYGFDRPKVAHDLLRGTPANRRVEIYIRGIDRATILNTLKP